MAQTRHQSLLNNDLFHAERLNAALFFGLWINLMVVKKLIDAFSIESHVDNYKIIR
ncbi:hypothetical protein FLL65_19295 [Vibrio cholerae]|nr:hypothetical protein [Vibrio cholerae]NOE78465.1 hypothetical protein [Vibrio cholerae]TQQ43069.1 hypothetical protein FLL65_19295 [Vibrio cholerae]